MGIKKSLFFLALYPLITFSQNYPFQVGESCTYRIYYGPITAGYGTLSVKSKKHLDKDYFYFEGTGNSNTFVDMFFRVRDEYISYTNTEKLQPIHFIRNVDEGGYLITQNYLFNPAKNTAIVEDSVYQISDNTQDMISAFYYARTLIIKQNLKEDSILKINIFMDEENYPMQIKYLNNEIVKTKWGKINCMVFVPQLQAGRIFKEEQEMRIWISDDENKLMIKVETKIIVGVISAELSAFEGLKSPLSITE